MSKFIVSARKYRPATFEEVVGQAHVADTLKNALVSDKLAHSFLFCGPRGVGKTTCARILAKVINCENPANKTQPCNECSSCTSFNDNASFNIIELDAASNNGVEHIRNLIDQVRIPPQQGRYKVFIIDEVHMLSASAFNAFLKTLEEPPSYAIFILATTEKHKILPTILSRCQIFDFKRIQVSDVAAQLADICKQEGLTAEPEALHLIGQKADGAMRDGLSIFDKIASAGGDTITYKAVITNLNILDYEYYFKVVDSFLKEDLSEVLLILDNVVSQGFEVDLFIQGLASHMRDLLVCKDQRTMSLLDVSDGLKSRYQQQAQYSTRSMLLSALDILNQCDVALPRATNKRLFAEIALSKINYLQRTIDTHIQTGGAAVVEKKTEVPSEPVKVQPEVTVTQPTIENKPPVQAPAEDIRPQQENTEQAQEEPPASVASNLTETKTPELVHESPASEVNTPSAPEMSSTPVQEQTVPAPEAITEEKKVEEQPTVKSAKVDLSIDSMMASLEAEDAAINAAKERFGIEAIKEIWDKYSEENPSPSVQAALNRVKIALRDDEHLTVTIPVAIAGDIIVNENALIEKIRTDLGVPSLVMEMEVKPELFPDYEEKQQPSNLKPREKYQLMLDKKPELKDLVQKLDLKPDNDVAF